MGREKGILKSILLALRWILIAPIWLYQKLVSPLIPSRCIYSPTCSHYATEAIRRHGLRGLLLGVTRVTRCVGGLYTGGDDPVPDTFSFREMLRKYRQYWNGSGN